MKNIWEIEGKSFQLIKRPDAYLSDVYLDKEHAIVYEPLNDEFVEIVGSDEKPNAYMEIYAKSDPIILEAIRVTMDLVSRVDSGEIEDPELMGAMSVMFLLAGEN